MTAASAWLRACAATASLLPAAGAQDLPSTEAVRQLLGDLDAAFAKGDADAYLARFLGGHAMLDALHGRQIRDRLLCGHRLSRTSEPLAPPRRCGSAAVVAVDYTTKLLDAPAQPPLRERGYLVLRWEDGRLRPVLAVPLPTGGSHCTADDTFRCDACNYRIGGVDGWLCVPVATERCVGLEASTFVLVDADVALDVSVQIGDAPASAAAVVAALADELRAAVPGAVAGMTEPWRPPGFALPAGVTAARATVDLADGQRTVLHATALGALRHLLLLRGNRKVLTAHAEAIDKLLASYRLLQPDAALAEQVALALNAHTGGVLDEEGRYRNERHGIEARGPEGWTGRLRCAGTAFEVDWTCPAGLGKLRLTGHRAPEGLGPWTTALADRWLDDLLAQAGLAAATADDSGWSAADAHGDRVRSLVVRRKAPQQTRWLRLVLRDDLLVVADGCVAPDADPEPLRAALTTVRRP